MSTGQAKPSQAKKKTNINNSLIKLHLQHLYGIPESGVAAQLPVPRYGHGIKAIK